MSHALTIPAHAVPTLLTDADRAPFHADPILAAIERHTEAYQVFQVAPDGEASEVANDETFDALHALLATPCATRAGMFCLIRHLRWWFTEEAVNADAYRADGGLDAWAIAETREHELSRLLGVERVERIPVALPSGRLIGPVLDLRLVGTSTREPYPVPTSTAVRIGRVLSRSGDVLATLVLIVGGIGLTGFASLI